MTYRVLEYFKDLQDNGYKYRAGDEYPRAGYKPSKDRIAELSTEKNKRNRPLIIRVEDESVEDIAPVLEEKPAAKPRSRGRKKNA